MTITIGADYASEKDRASYAIAVNGRIVLATDDPEKAERAAEWYRMKQWLSRQTS